EQQSRGGPVATLGRKNKGAHSIGQGVVYIGTSCKQRANRLDISGTRGKQQWGASATQHGIVQLFAPRTLRHFARDYLSVCTRTSTEVGACIEQHLHRLRMFFSRRPHQGGLIMLWLLRIYLRARAYERFHGSGVPRPGAVHQYCFPIEERRVGIGFRAKERLDRQRISTRAGKIEGGYAHVIGEVDPRARAKQQIDGCEVIVVNSPMKRRRTITLSCVDIDTRLEQGPNG